MSKHTPGPWKYVSGQVEREDGAVIARMDRSQAATLAGIMPVERDANARLIASAPELLACLKMSFDFLVVESNILHKESISIRRDEAILTLKNIIAKAEGRSYDEKI